jgi:hypothetical protein
MTEITNYLPTCDLEDRMFRYAGVVRPREL